MQRDHVDADRRAKELEFKAKFQKLAREYGNNLAALKERLTSEREQDFQTYQQYKNTYSRFCREEDYIRENIHVLDGEDPQKEEYIRDMIQIENNMREVQQEPEIQEMMIIKRESLFQEKFSNSDNQVIINAEPLENIDYDKKSNKKSLPAKKQSNQQSLEPSTEKTSADLRIPLERERLLKRLGPELNTLDPALPDKLMSTIMDNKTDENEATDKRQIVKELTMRNCFKTSQRL